MNYNPIEFPPAPMGSSLWIVQMCYVNIIKGLNNGQVHTLGAGQLLKGYEYILTHTEPESTARRFLKAKDRFMTLTPVEFMERDLCAYK